MFKQENLESSENIQHYVLKSMGLSHRKSGMIGLYQTIRWSRDESKQFQMAAAVTCSFVPMTAYPRVLQISAPDFGHLSKSTNEAERRRPKTS